VIDVRVSISFLTMTVRVPYNLTIRRVQYSIMTVLPVDEIRALCSILFNACCPVHPLIPPLVVDDDGREWEWSESLMRGWRWMSG